MDPAKPVLHTEHHRRVFKKIKKMFLNDRQLKLIFTWFSNVLTLHTEVNVVVYSILVPQMYLIANKQIVLYSVYVCFLWYRLHHSPLKLWTGILQHWPSRIHSWRLKSLRISVPTYVYYYCLTWYRKTYTVLDRARIFI